MKIESYKIYKVSIPTRRRHTWASSTADVGQGWVILEVKTDDGIVGYGEATTMPEWGGDFGRYYGESYETTEVVIRDNLFPAIMGMDPFDIDLIHHRMDKAIRGFVYAKAAIDIALYDIMGKALDKPVYKLLGGQHRKAIPIAHSLGVVLDIEAAVDEAVAACGEGIKTIKMKGGLDPVRDMELMEKLRKAVGPHINILVDANQGYPTAKDAIKWGKRMDRFDLQYLEQPVEGFDQLREVTRMLEVPVCADESCWTPTDALDIVAKHAADYISIYVTKAGGLYPARAVAKIAECAGIRCNVNGSGEFGVGTAANLHMACCGANIDLASVFPITHVEGCPEQTKVAARWYMDDIITKPFQYDDGCLLVPDGPGLGVEIDRESIAYLHNHYPDFAPRLIEGDFLKMDLKEVFPDGLRLIGNFPYNISSQIFFKLLENRDMIPECVGMVQREVAVRIAEKPGSKEYGILSVLLQAWYDIEYLFTVNESVFNPPPKVKSAVIRLRRNSVRELQCDERLFVQVVKAAFGQRRKMLRNALRSAFGAFGGAEHRFFSERAERLSVTDFVELTRWVAEHRTANHR